MNEAKQSLSKRFRRIAIIELTIFFCLTGIRYILGVRQFDSIIDIAECLLWLSFLVYMLYAAYAIMKETPPHPYLFIVIATVYILFFVQWIISFAPILVDEQITTGAKLGALVPTLMYQAWFSWLLSSSAIRWVAANKLTSEDESISAKKLI